MGPNETASFVGTCLLNIWAGDNNAIIIGAPFLNDFYQVYDLQRNQVGLVPSIFVNAPNDEGIFASSPPESVDMKKTKPIILWLLVGGWMIAASLRNLVVQNVKWFENCIYELNEDNNKEDYDLIPQRDEAE